MSSFNFTVNVCFLVLCLVSLDVIGQDVDLFSRLNDVIQEHKSVIQKEMKNGIPALRIPKMEPLVLNPINLDHNAGNVQVALNLRQVNIHGLTTFDYTLSRDPKNSINLDLSFPTAVIDGQYKLDGKAFGIFPLFGDGAYKLNFREATVNFKGDFVDDGNFRVIFKARHISFDYGSTSATFENILGGGSLAKLVEDLFPVFGKYILHIVQPEIQKALNPVLSHAIGDAIKDNAVQIMVRALFLS